jgi:hypothetical protein
MKTKDILLFISACLPLLAAICVTPSATGGSPPALLDRSSEPFRIMNWWSPVKENLTEKQVDLMVDCGLNYLLFMGYSPEHCKRALSCASKYPWVEAIVWDERIFGADAPKPGESFSNIATVVNDYQSYRAFKGFVVRDEPGTAEFPRFGRIMSYTRSRWPGIIPYVNLFPNYVNVKDAGAKSYDEYIQQYLACRPPMVSYDHYPFPKEGVAPAWFDNLEVVRRECLSAGVPPWVIVQFSAFPGMRAVNEGELRWCVNSAMAYGYRSVCYFCYATPAEDGFAECAINLDGSVNPKRYALLKKINREIAPLGSVLMALTSRRVYHTAPLPQGTQGIPKDGWVRAFSSGEWMAGELQGRHGSYVMVVNRNPHKPGKASISWTPDIETVYRVSRQDLALEPVKLKRGKAEGRESEIDMEPGAGELFYIGLSERPSCSL